MEVFMSVIKVNLLSQSLTIIQPNSSYMENALLFDNSTGRRDDLRYVMGDLLIEEGGKIWFRCLTDAVRRATVGVPAPNKPVFEIEYADTRKLDAYEDDSVSLSISMNAKTLRFLYEHAMRDTNNLTKYLVHFSALTAAHLGTIETIEKLKEVYENMWGAEGDVIAFTRSKNLVEKAESRYCVILLFDYFVFGATKYNRNEFAYDYSESIELAADDGLFDKFIGEVENGQSF
jgi:hypothetical protein